MFDVPDYLVDVNPPTYHCDSRRVTPVETALTIISPTSGRSISTERLPILRMPMGHRLRFSKWLNQGTENV